MQNLNMAQILGNLTRDPDIKDVGSTKVCTFGVATNINWKNDKEEWQSKVEFHNVKAWRGLAELCADKLSKGSKVYIQGKLETESWEKDGQKNSRTFIVAESMINLDAKQDFKGGLKEEAMEEVAEEEATA
jgi:single-strand DNA-binding protein